jgi:formylglycine-generating enzyme required for sulfatase activity
MEFLPVGPGTFDMGSNDGDSDEKPVHRVRIGRTFWMGKTEVTQDQWAALMGKHNVSFAGGQNPMESVSWTECVEFCRKLTDREHGAGRLPAGYEFRLPTEAEWEYAARGGSKSRGLKYAGSDDVDEVAWYGSNSGLKTHEVGTKGPNELGLYDMSGNVWEWCLDDWHDSYNGAPADGSRWGDGSGSFRVLRGGGWGFDASRCRSADRNWLGPSYANVFLGFRVVLAPVP